MVGIDLIFKTAVALAAYVDAFDMSLGQCIEHHGTHDTAVIEEIKVGNIELDLLHAGVGSALNRTAGQRGIIHNIIGNDRQTVSDGFGLFSNVERKGQEATLVAAQIFTVQPDLCCVGNAAEVQHQFAGAQHFRRVKEALVDHITHMITDLTTLVDIIVRAGNGHRPAVLQGFLRIIFRMHGNQCKFPHTVQRNPQTAGSIIRIKHDYCLLLFQSILVQRSFRYHAPSLGLRSLVKTPFLLP